MTNILSSNPSNNRRGFFRNLGVAAAAATAGSVVPNLFAQNATMAFQNDTPAQILTAALIAEDLATTFYYNAINGKAIAASVRDGSVEGDDVDYLKAAMKEEMEHANLLRSLLGIAKPADDPFQTFYFPKDVFDTVDPKTGMAFIPVLDALENAFIGAYLTAVRSFAYMAANTSTNRGVYYKLGNSNLSSDQLGYFSQVSASIMGVEAEHRALGRVIGGNHPANNRCYQQTAGLDSVFGGMKSAVVALTPFLTPTTGPAFTLKQALDNSAGSTLPCEFGPPAF